VVSSNDSGRRRWTITAAEAGGRVDAWLAGREEVGSRTRAREWVERGKVFLNGLEVTFDRAGRRLAAGDELVLWIDRPGSSARQSRDVVARRASLRIVFEDHALVVLDKPAGILVEPLPGDRPEVTLQDLLADRLRPSGGAQALVVHRIDRDTTGLVLFAKDPGSQAALKRQFERRTARRVYLAVTTGRFREREGTWVDQLVWDKARLVQRRARPDDDRAVVKEARASYRVLEQFADTALLEVQLQTGKRNQIRVQAALRHHPLVGEHIYAKDGPAPFARQALHAVHLAFRHPATGKEVEFDAPVPADMRRLIERLRKAEG
jgi:23S rRNA pseudouridine1911/1915/1917 synthase